MGRSGDALGARAGERQARIARARARRLEVDSDRAAREARIDAAVADVYLAQSEEGEARKVIAAGDFAMGLAILRIIAERVPIAQVAELTQLTATEVRKLKSAAGSAKRKPVAIPDAASAGAASDGVRA